MKNKINVNISPNPLDLQTLHCSQNDTEERKFYFTLHNNGEVIDTTDISDPIFEPFSVYKGGTEQLLPVNTDDPSTSPIIADIQYPDEEKTEQEFTYRESPTTIDGNALVEKIKGNTLVWNQLNANINKRKEYTSTNTSWAIRNIQDPFNFVVGHKYYFVIDANIQGGVYRMRYPFVSTETSKSTNIIHEITVSDTLQFAIQHKNNSEAETTYVLDNIQVFDLTLMFGSTKADEIYAMEQSQSGSGVAYFRSLFGLPYYTYDSGSLLSFNGEGIKTTGKNLLYNSLLEGYFASGYYYSDDKYRSVDVVLEKGIYTFTSGITSTRMLRMYINDVEIQIIRDVDTYTFELNERSRFRISFRSEPIGDLPDDIPAQIEIGSVSTSYEPYTTSTTSLPTLTYFPSGMNKVNDTYDEWTPTKTTIRTKTIVFDGTEKFVTGGQGEINFVYIIPNQADYGKFNIYGLYSKGQWGTYAYNPTESQYGTVSFGSWEADRICFLAVGLKMTMEQFKQELASAYASGSPYAVCYELATEQVTEFTHASLICEDGESTLYQDVDSLVCDCTEDFSKDSGFKDCKIKFSKGDGVVYSNKIQLHIERKP